MLRSISIYVCAALAGMTALTPAASAAVLFPTPLHLTRAVEEPLSGSKVTIEEYYFANRVITIRGDRTVIVDYDKREMTEIDRAKATYSVTPFDAIANARPHRAIVRDASAKPSVARTRSERRGGHGVDVYSGEDKAVGLQADIAVDNSVGLSRDAFDVIVGSAYPNDSGPAADLTRSAARHEGGAAESYGLPMEQTLRWDGGGKSIESKNVVTRVSEESAPPELLVIPPGTQQVESRVLRAKKLGDEVDSLPRSSANH